MRWLAGICALVIGLSVNGCAIIEAEKNNRGGFLDKAADDLWMKADSKKMRALRALAIEASLARIAMITPKSAPDRALLARRIGQTSVRADVVRQCAFPRTPVATGQRSDEPCFFFDSVMVDYENALFDLALIALPIDDAKNLLTRVTGGIAAVSVNPLELVQALVDIGREAFRYGRVVGAIYRDTLELEVQIWLASPQFAEAERARGQPEQFVVTAERVSGLAAAYVRGNDNIPAWRAEIAALRAEGLEPVPHERFIQEIYSVLGYICGQIVNEKDPSYEECRQSALIKNLPVVSDASLFGPVTRRAAVTRSVTPPPPSNGAEQELRESLRQKEAELLRLRKLQLRGAIGPTEEAMSGATLLGYKQALCVTGSDATTDTFDSQTRQRLREFVSGIKWAPELEQTAAPTVIDPNLESRLQSAVRISPSCGAANAVAKNAYEAGVYARSGIVVVNDEVLDALTRLRLDQKLKGRDAIAALRTKFGTQNPSTNGAQLDPSLWSFIRTEARKKRDEDAPTPPPPPVAPR